MVAQPIEIEVRGLFKRFDELTVLNRVDFDVRKDEVVALIGPSGSGKSTLLRCLNLLEFPTEGEFRLKGTPVNYRSMTPQQLTLHRTRMGMVFQHFHLFPHRTALENVIEGPVHVLGKPVSDAMAQGRDLLDQVGLSDKHNAWPSQLSGGQKQRVAIARALAMEPEVLLLDEITSALDVEMIAGINDLLAELAENGMTMVIVTHDLSFARRAADRICVLDSGAILETGNPEQVLDHPSDPRVNQFLQAVKSV
jgi:ABC-type polar amino acid transport system ATPase subunit